MKQEEHFPAPAGAAALSSRGRNRGRRPAVRLPAPRPGRRPHPDVRRPEGRGAGRPEGGADAAREFGIVVGPVGGQDRDREKHPTRACPRGLFRNNERSPDVSLPPMPGHSSGTGGGAHSVSEPSGSVPSASSRRGRPRCPRPTSYSPEQPGSGPGPAIETRSRPRNKRENGLVEISDEVRINGHSCIMSLNIESIYIVRV